MITRAKDNAVGYEGPQETTCNCPYRLAVMESVPMAVDNKLYHVAGKTTMNAEKPSHASKIKQETALSSLAQHRDPEFGSSIPMLHGDIKPQLNMRIPIYCPDFNSYLECPEKYLPQEVRCIRDASHKTLGYGSAIFQIINDR